MQPNGWKTQDLEKEIEKEGRWRHNEGNTPEMREGYDGNNQGPNAQQAGNANQQRRNISNNAGTNRDGQPGANV